MQQRCHYIKINFELIKMSFNYLGQLIFLSFSSQNFDKVQILPAEILNLTRFNEIINEDCKIKKKNNP